MTRVENRHTPGNRPLDQKLYTSASPFNNTHRGKAPREQNTGLDRNTTRKTHTEDQGPRPPTPKSASGDRQTGPSVRDHSEGSGGSLASSLLGKPTFVITTYRMIATRAVRFKHPNTWMNCGHGGSGPWP